MTAAELQATRVALGLGQGQISRLFGVDDRTWRRWETGALPMPGTAQQLLRIALAHRQVLEWLAREVRE